MSLEKITILVGSPGSGKSTLGYNMEKENNGVLFIDDMSIQVKDNPIAYIQEVLRADVNHLVIADVNFCFTNVRNQAIQMLESKLGIGVSCIYFENNLEKCLKNIERRRQSGDNRRVENLAKIISEKYEIPEGQNIVEIFDGVNLKPRR